MTLYTDDDVVRVLDVLAPLRSFGGAPAERFPIFEWSHETTPTDEQMTELARRILDAALPAYLNRLADETGYYITANCDDEVAAWLRRKAEETP